jgi:hypothetical protein
MPEVPHRSLFDGPGDGSEALQDPRLLRVKFGTIQMYAFDDRGWAVYQNDELRPVGRIFEEEYPY